MINDSVLDQLDSSPASPAYPKLVSFRGAVGAGVQFAQREACEAYIASQRSESWMLVRDHYGDGGISGGTLVERVDIGTGGLDVRLRVDGLGGLAREMLVVDIGAAA